MDKLNIKSFESFKKSLPELNLKVKASILGISGLTDAVEGLSSSMAMLGKMLSSVNFSAITGEIASLNTSISILGSTLDSIPSKQNTVNDSTSSYSDILSKTGEIIIKSLLGPIGNLTDRIDDTGKTTNVLTGIFKHLLTAIYDIATGLTVLKALSPTAFDKIVQYGVLVGTAFRSVLSIIGVVSAAIVTFGITVMGVINAVRSIPMLISTFQRNFAGESIIDIGLDNIKEMSFGVIDFTRKPESAVKDKPLNRMGDRLQLDRELNEEQQIEKDKQAEWENNFKKISFSRSNINFGNTQNIESYEEELNLVKLQESELENLNKKLQANIGNLGAELDIKKQILDIEREITRLKTGEVPNTGVMGESPALAQNFPAFKAVSHLKDLNLNPPEQPEWRATLIMEEELPKQRLEAAQGMWQNFQGMLQATGLMKGQFGEIINFINSFLNSISSGVSFVDSLIGFFSTFIPGGSVIAGIASGGGAMPGIGGMSNIGGLSSYNTYQTLNAARSSSPSRLNQASVNISGELRLKGKDAVYVYDRNKAIQTSLIN